MRSERGHGAKATERIAFGLLALATFLVVAPVIYIVVFILVNGSGSISWEFLTQAPRHRGLEGGIFPAIVGTFYLMIGTLLFALPVGVFSAIYLTEYARRNWLTRLINLSIVNLAGVPSIVFGLFGLGLFVLAMRSGSSLLAASLTLACQALAMIITTSREALMAVPRSYREGSLALGATKWQTVLHVVLPQAMPGIITGTVLATSRAIGETAPILAVGAAFLLPSLPSSPLDQFMALPYHLYIVATQVPGMPERTMWGTALVLLVVVLSFNTMAMVVRWRFRQRRV
ncbi:MAG: phosphate ABC transporter permease PstA [Chloroflexi bacterium]|nr:phosphate ABC transporter permease PstA [Chloroflexota bacterium]